MPIDTQRLSSLTWADHLSNFPLAASAFRENPDQGIAKHIPVEEMIKVICGAVATTLKSVVIQDLVTGTANVPGVFIPTPGKQGAVFTFPGAKAAAVSFASLRGWMGKDSQKAAAVFIEAPLKNAAIIGELVMNTPLLAVGTGAGTSNPASNAGLLADSKAKLLVNLRAGFEASPFFFEADIPEKGVNQKILEALPDYADALSQGIATFLSFTTYTGPVGATTPVGPIPNQGAII